MFNTEALLRAAMGGVLFLVIATWLIFFGREMIDYYFHKKEAMIKNLMLNNEEGE